MRLQWPIHIEIKRDKTNPDLIHLYITIRPLLKPKKEPNQHAKWNQELNDKYKNQ